MSRSQISVVLSVLPSLTSTISHPPSTGSALNSATSFSMVAAELYRGTTMVRAGFMAATPLFAGLRSEQIPPPGADATAGSRPPGRRAHFRPIRQRREATGHGRRAGNERAADSERPPELRAPAKRPLMRPGAAHG